MRRHPWYIATRPHTLPAAIAPVLVGGGLAVGDGVFSWGPFVAAAVGALAIQVAANLANDLSDARRGADTPDRIGPPRAVASGMLSEGQVRRGIWVSFAVAIAAGLYLTVVAGWVVIAVGLASIAATLTYTGGPSPYGYRGWGEVFVFVFFGVVATVMTRYVFDQTAPLDAWLLSIPMGFLVTAILVANNVRDIETDRAAGKRTLAVILGRERTRILFDVLVWGSFVAVAAFAACGAVPRWSALALAAAPGAVPLTRTIHRETAGPPLIAVLMGVARLDLTVGVLIALGVTFG